MIELPRIYQQQLVYVPNTQLAPTQTVADKTQSDPQQDRRKQQNRRKHNLRPLIERRVSSDRRGHLLEIKV